MSKVFTADRLSQSGNIMTRTELHPHHITLVPTAYLFDVFFRMLTFYVFKSTVFSFFDSATTNIVQEGWCVETKRLKLIVVLET